MMTYQKVSVNNILQVTRAKKFVGTQIGVFFNTVDRITSSY